MLRIIRFIFVLLIIFSGLAMHLRNDQSVVFDYYLGVTEASFSIFLIIALTSGTLLGAITCLPVIVRQKRENRVLLSRLRLCEKELDNLRVIPARH